MSPRKQILHDFLHRIWGEQDLSAIPEFIADSYIIHNDPGDPWDGRTLSRDEFRNRLTTSRSVAPDQRFTPVHMTEDGDRIAVAWTWEGTHLGDMPGLPATGRSLRMTGLTIYFFEGNRLCGHWQVTDRLGIYRQMTAPDQNSGN
ncbi:ester cyclase [Thalassovita sp.]|uniref:ester cyclase n=1 Tax=Thalassovita sp. TaxID=1979401 RepID=UPI0029DE51A8|nr:ester cyclase [Thalassovita sp.]